jgi:flagellin-like protein
MIRELISDTADGDRAVSPVIGVILMVAITVILATVIGAIVLDFGNNAGETAPSASLSVDASTSSDTVTIEHTGGDSLDSEQTRVIVEVNDTSVTLDETNSANATTLAVGTDAIIDFNTKSGTGEGINWDSSTSPEEFNYYEAPAGIGALSAGDTVTITIIDTDTQRQIYKTTVTA